MLCSFWWELEHRNADIHSSLKKNTRRKVSKTVTNWFAFQLFVEVWWQEEVLVANCIRQSMKPAVPTELISWSEYKKFCLHTSATAVPEDSLFQPQVTGLVLQQAECRSVPRKCPVGCSILNGNKVSPSEKNGYREESKEWQTVNPRVKQDAWDNWRCWVSSTIRSHRFPVLEPVLHSDVGVLNSACTLRVRPCHLRIS